MEDDTDAQIHLGREILASPGPAITIAVHTKDEEHICSWGHYIDS